jgi:predicted nucleotidyltransferase
MSVTTEHFNKAVKIAQEYGATSLLLFGSALKDPLNANDIDLACDGVDDTRFFHLAAELENTLMIPVDLVPLASGGPFIEYIKKYGRYLI